MSEPQAVTAMCANVIALFAKTARQRRMTRQEQEDLLRRMVTGFDQKVAMAMFRIVRGNDTGRTNADKAARVLIGWSGSEVWPAPIDDDLSGIVARAEHAVMQQYAEDAECMGEECLDLIDELRATRAVARASERFRRFHRAMVMVVKKPHGTAGLVGDVFDRTFSKGMLALSELDKALSTYRKAKRKRTK